MFTEYEWRRKRRQVARQPEWVGAQCVFPKAGWRRLKCSRRFHRGLLLAACGISFAFFLCSSVNAVNEEPIDLSAWNAQVIQGGKKGAFLLSVPADMQLETCEFTRQQLLSGKMMVIDTQHRMPQDMPSPNTFSIASYGSCCIPTRSAKIKTGKETLGALEALFKQLEAEKIDGLCVYAGITTEEEQHNNRVAVSRKLMKRNKPSVACEAAVQYTEEPGTGALLLPYAVDVRPIDGGSGLTSDLSLYDTEQGKRFMDLAWRYGFVPEGQEHPYRFRYVGKAHATAITYLNLSFTDYLNLMHDQRLLIINEGGKPAYLITCVPYEGVDAVFELPKYKSCEVSIDNLGYALAACVL